MRLGNGIAGRMLAVMAVLIAVLVPATPALAGTEENERAVYDYCVNEMGLNTAAACGVLANIYYESGFDPTAVGDGGTSYGICQWHNSRWTGLVNHCSLYGLDSSSVYGQMHWLECELSGSEAATGNYLRDVPNTDEGAYNAGYNWCVMFERPSNAAAKGDVRGSRARDVYWPKYRQAEDFDFGPNVSLPAGGGTYTICSTLDTRLYLEVGGGSAEDGGNVQLWPGDGDEPQRRWDFWRNDDGTYTIWRYGTNKVLDVSAGSGEDGANVHIWESTGGANQRWWVQDCGNGVYALKAAHSGKFLDVAYGATADGTNVWQWHGHDRDGFGHSEKFFITPSYGPSVSLPQGGGPKGVTYNIASLSNPGVFVEVAGGGTGDGDNVQLWEREDESQRRWDLWRNDDGTYTIWRYGTNKVLDVAEGSLAMGANVQIWEATGADNQRWWLEDCGDGVYVLKAKHSGRFLDVSGGGAAKGVNLQQWQGNLTDAQRFIISPSFGHSVRLPEGDGLYEVVPVLSDKFVLDIEGASKEDGGPLVLAYPNGGANQRFSFAMNGDGTYTITAAHSGKVLDVSGSSRASEAKVHQWAPTGNDNQRWWIEDLGGGEYAIKSKRSGKFLDVKDGVAQDRQGLWQYAGNGSAAQRFRIVRWRPDLSGAVLGAIAPQPVGAEPDPEVSYDGVVLTRGVDYELSWSGNDRPGTATVTATGIGNFRGSVTAEFAVLDPEIDGWVDLPGGRKGYAKNGKLVLGWMDLGSSKFWFQPDGSMSTGWTDVEVNGKTMHYYFNPKSGNLVRGTWFEIGGHKYYFRPSGNVAHGWATISDNGVDKKYYFDDDYHLVTGWADIDNGQGQVNHYYFRPSGSMATGWATIDGQKYWFRPSGNMATGFTTVDDGYKRYFDKDGHMLTGWRDISGKRYYFRTPSGAMQTGEAVIDGKRYIFSDKGVLVAGPLAAQSDADGDDSTTEQVTYLSEEVTELG